MAGETFNAKEAATRAGVSVNTIKAWITGGKLNASKQEQGIGGPAEWMIPADEMQRFLAKRAASSRKVAQTAGDLQAQIDDLRRRLEALEAKAYGGARRQAAATMLDDFRLRESADPSEKPQERVQRHIGIQRSSDSLPPLPNGFVSLKELEKVHGCPKSTVARNYKSAPGGPWSSGQAGGWPITVAFDRETAERIIAKHGRVPPSSPAREPVPTVKRPPAAADTSGAV